MLLSALELQAGVTAEQILGEYWNDPLFGLAATDKTINIEILSSRIWPESISVRPDAKVRIVVHNKTDDFHLIAFSEDLESLQESSDFQAFIKDELFHAKQKKQQGRNHSHSGTGVGDAQSIVKTIPQNPTVFVRPDEKKEVLVRFTEVGLVSFACVLDGHEENLEIGIIRIE